MLRTGEPENERSKSRELLLHRDLLLLHKKGTLKSVTLPPEPRVRHQENRSLASNFYSSKQSAPVKCMKIWFSWIKCFFFSISLILCLNCGTDDVSPMSPNLLYFRYIAFLVRAKLTVARLLVVHY